MLALLAGLALAQDDAITTPYPIDIERFRPFTDTYGYAVTDSSTTLQNLQLGVGIWGNYSDDPVTLVWDGERVIGPGPKFPDGLVDRRSIVDLQVGLGLGDMFSLTVDAPVVIWQEGFEPAAEASPVPTSDLQGAGLGDLRIRPKFVLLDIETDGVPVGVALLADVTVPTGAVRSFIGDGTLTATPLAVLEFADGTIHRGEYHVRGAVNVGAKLKSSDQFRDVPFGPELVYKVAIGAKPAPALEIGGDLSGGSSGARVANNPLEILPWLKLHPADFITITGGAGFGLVPGVGAPDIRAFLGASLAPNFDPLDLDRDGDGIPNKLDACINIPEDKDGFEDEDGCPEDDNDKDTILDPVDRCPDIAEDFDQFQDEDGCPDNDNDGDKILDWPQPLDACPNQPEDVDGDRDTDGCPETPADSDGDGLNDEVDGCPYDPEDRDGFQDADGCPELDNDADRILDAFDRCPLEPEVYNGFSDEDGCPDQASRVIVEKERIVITDKVFFEFGKAIIKDVSFELLNEVAAVMNDHPEITAIQVEGHTDSVGSDSSNLRLSQARADSVMKFLVSAGVAQSRLTAVGYGETRPIETNATPEGQAQNRRVEFTILGRE